MLVTFKLIHPLITLVKRKKSVMDTNIEQRVFSLFF